MTTVIGINENNDMYMDETNNIAIFSGQTSNKNGQTAIEQAAKTATLAQLTEMILFTTQGMPALQQVFVGSPNYSLYQTALVAAIENIDDVVSVTSLVLSATGGIMSYTATVETIYGTMVIDG